MPYIGTSPSNGVRRKHTYTATASQTSFSGAGAEGATLSYKDSNYVDVYQNGVKLSEADYTATTGTTVVLATGATVSDMIEIIVYDVFSVADTVSKADGGTFDGNVTMAGTLAVTGATALNGADVTLADGVDLITASAGTSNVRIGVNAGNSITSGGNYNTVVGDEAGTAITTGDNNTLLGYQTGDALTTPFGNVAIGDRALSAETTGQRNTAVGSTALFAQNNTGNELTYNTAVGYQSGGAITTGLYNTLVGGLVGDALTDADKNVALGYGTLTADTLGSRSTAVGYSALATQNFTTATDSHNTAVGNEAGTLLTTGIENVIVGSLAGDAMTDADRNTAVGYVALSTNTKSDRNTAIGRSALENLNHTSVTSGLNTAIGHGAGSVITTGTKNTIIGCYGGNQSSLDIRTSDNNIVLSDGDGEAQLCINGSGVISIGGIKTPTSTDATLNISQHGSGFPLLCHRTGTGDGVQVSFHNDNNQVGRINTSGSATSYVTSSDYRLKENVTTSWDATTRLKQLKPSRFNFKTDADTTVDGFLAHEVSSIVPEAITGEKDAVDSDGNPDYQGIDHSKLVPLLVKTLQEALTEIDTLKTKVAALEGE